MSSKAIELNENISYLQDSQYNQFDTIVSQATAIGFAGVGIVRISGCSDAINEISKAILKKTLKPRYAYYGEFYSKKNEILDKGVALYFNNPYSYTGEDVLELHCHGGPIIIDNIISEAIQLGARLAEPGEFTKRAWLNGKMDLAQVEAVSDLIHASSKHAAQSAINTLTGKFSEIINNFLTRLIELRVYVEAAIDFSDEQIDFIVDGEVNIKLNDLLSDLEKITTVTKQGVILKEGVKIVIAGKPNAGKSSLLNALSKSNEAIVTDIPGTTRDLIKTDIVIKGVPIKLIDTAGIRETSDLVEKQGVELAKDNLASADVKIIIIDIRDLLDNNLSFDFNQEFNNKIRAVMSDLGINTVELNNNDTNTIVLINKSDLLDNYVLPQHENNNTLFVSVKCDYGLQELEELILNKIGFSCNTTEGNFTARRRHLDSLYQVKQNIEDAKELLNNAARQDIIAEELRLAQQNLSKITGEYSPDDLLGNIFSSFCIGK